MSDGYKYKLQYTYKDTIVTHEFNSDLDIYELAEHLRDFLCGCSWSERQIKDIIHYEE